MSNTPTCYRAVPSTRPITPLLDTIDSPATLRALNVDDLYRLANELRAFLLYSVGRTGGHLGAGLGVVELTIVLHYLLDTPKDSLVWDVGHQTYPHKILCGRREQMASLRQTGGLAGFPKREESEFDSFGTGHSSTSISAALGMALAYKHRDLTHKAVAVIGDGAMTAGMAFEALNHCAHTQANVLIVLNDNTMSISQNVGGLATYFKRHAQNNVHTDTVTSNQSFFENLGLHYQSIRDGHNIDTLLNGIQQALKQSGPVLLHVITQKGFGFLPAMEDPRAYHAISKIEASEDTEQTAHNGIKYQDVFGTWLCDTAEQDKSLIAITPAMTDGSGMRDFASRFTERFYDVAIAEQHALTFAAGLACQNMKPVVAIYSTFLQRAYDQYIHDIALQNLDVTLAIDRAGLVGDDGATHSGNFDISYLRCIPSTVIATPSDEHACRQLLNSAYHHPGPAVVRYPRGQGPGSTVHTNNENWPVGKGYISHTGNTVCILNFGALHHYALTVAQAHNYSLCDMRWAKPLDTSLIDHMLDTHNYLVTLEDNSVCGGAGSAVLEYLQQHKATHILTLGIPDEFVEQGPRSELLHNLELDAEGITQRIQQWLENQE